MQAPMAAQASPTRADFERLMAEWARLQADADALRAQFRQQAEEVHTQSIRIIQIQATLDQQH